MKEMVGGCCVCSDERGWPENPLVYCDGANCNVAVHQACYGIVTVPTGPWYCRKCESQERSARVRCELCPSRTGALKKTNTSGWAHVVCALYIPEVRFGNVTTMEPINLDSIPVERYGKTCYICQEMNKGSKAQMGACMQCNKTGCRQQFHVTCAQQLGLLCEEAGNYLDNVKYCGYCQHHYSKLKKGGNVKLIPPYKPITYETGSSDGPSSPEKESETMGNVTTAIAGNHVAGSGSSAVVGNNSAANVGATKATPSTSLSGHVPLNATSSSHVMGTTTATKVTTPTLSPANMSSSAANAIHSLPQTGSSATMGVPSGAPSSLGTSSSASSSTTSSKARKSSSTTKSSISSTTGSSSSSSSNQQQTANSMSMSTSTSGSGSKSGIGSGSTSSSKDYKDKHGGSSSSSSSSSSSKGSNKQSSSKERGESSYKDKKSSSSGLSSSSSSKNKDQSSSSSHHHHHHHESSSKVDKGDKNGSMPMVSGASTLSTSSGNQTKAISSGSILAPSILQATANAKEMASKFQNYVDPASVPTMSDPSFGHDGKNSMAAVSTKKRKATEAAKLNQQQQQSEDKLHIKDPSVTMVSMRPYEKHEVIGDAKKVKTEGGSPLQMINEPNLHTVSNLGNGGNLLATPTSATSISITKQPMTSSNVIIKPPIIKDLGSSMHGSALTACGGGVTSGGSGVGNTPSLVVSVPLSSASGAAGLNLTGTNSSSTGQNLFQQAIQNRSEHLNFSNAVAGSRHSSSSINRASPIIAVSNVSAPSSGASPSLTVAPSHHLHQQQHHPDMLHHQQAPSHHHQQSALQHHRQSPLVQSAQLNMMDNGSTRASLSPANSDHGPLKIMYEKQHTSAIVTPPSIHRLSSNLQDDMVSGRRSRTPDSQYSTSFGGGGSANAGGGGSNSGGLKFTYEAQTPSGALAVMTTSGTSLLTPSPSPSMAQMGGSSHIASNTIGAQPIVKDSPPSSPSSEAGSSARKRTRKQQEQIPPNAAKIFQNGVHASHMLGNQLNPNSSMAQKMSDQLNMEIEAHSVYTSSSADSGTNLIGPPFPGKHSSSSTVPPGALSSASSASSSLKSGGAGGAASLSSMLAGGGVAGGAAGGAPQSLEQLLERQWEQGSQFLMEQAQHFDIASLLSCLHQLRTENVRLEEHVNNLVARRDHLLAVNARLAIPLNPPTSTSGQFVPSNTNNSGGIPNGPNADQSLSTAPSNIIQSVNNAMASGINSGSMGGNRSRAGSGIGQNYVGSMPMENGIDFRHSVVSVHQQAGGSSSGSASTFVGTMHNR